jgi:hypothetical protein
MKIPSSYLAMCAAISVLAGCGKASSTSTDNSQQPDTAAQPVSAEQSAMDATLFQRGYGHAKSLVNQKQYKRAQDAISALAGSNLTPEQKKMLDDLKTQIPQN